MAGYSGEVFAERAYIAGIPARIVAHKCGNWGLSPARAADLAEEAAAEAYYRSLTHCFANWDHYRGWITETALNYAIDKLRRASRSQSLTWVAPTADGSSDHDSLAAGLAEGMAALAEEERALLKLTYDEELTLDQIAGRVAAEDKGSLNAKRLRIKRKRDEALRKLRAYLVKNGYWNDRRPPERNAPNE